MNGLLFFGLYLIVTGLRLAWQNRVSSLWKCPYPDCREKFNDAKPMWEHHFKTHYTASVTIQNLLED